METISDLIYKGINIKKENNFALSKINKFCNSFYDKTSNIKKFNSEIDSIRKKNRYSITMINHLKTIIFEKIKIIKINNELSKNIEREKIRKIKINFSNLIKLFDNIYVNRESLSLALTDMPNPAILESSITKEITYLKNIVFESTFSNFKLYKKECLDLFDKVEICKKSENKEEFPKEYIEYSNEFIQEHKDYLNNIENQYLAIGELLDNLIIIMKDEINKYKDLSTDINDITALINESQLKANIFRKQNNLISNLNASNVAQYKKVFDDFKENLSSIIETEEKNIVLANKSSLKLKDLKNLIKGFAVQTIKNKFMFLEDHLMVLNDKAREIKIHIS